ncbi:glycosyltransferase family 2 protein [Allohahella marinimesophila]|uniref:Glycosyltransferase n=1 Tax=Allohahella marinimesophila TaxID=1054972 RepID=A0ABP7PZP2_9GAMM
MAKITVVIPAYNAANTIQSCLDSVCQQRRPADEIIVVDDGSSDDTSRLVSAYGHDVKLIVQENQGSAKARQTGSDAAKGDYIAYLDSDDWWLDTHLSEVERVLNAATVDFLFTDLRRAWPTASPSEYSARNSTFFPWFKESFLEKAKAVRGVDNCYKFSQRQSLNLLLRGFPVYPSTVVVSKRALNKVGEWDVRFRRCQDFDFSLRVARHFGIFYFDDVHTILGLHDVNADVNKYVLMQTLGDIKVLETHLSENQHHREYAESVKLALSSKLYNLGRRYMAQEDYKNAINTFIRSASFPGKRMKALIQSHLSALLVFKHRWVSLRDKTS